MQQNKSINFGTRGWLLCIYQFIAYMVYSAVGWPMNVLSDVYSPANPSLVSTLYTIGGVVGIGLQLVLSSQINKIKNVKKLSMIMGICVMILFLGMMLIPPGTGWFVVFFLICAIDVVWCTFTVGIIIGQWFPTRKGTVMGIVTLAFPIANFLVSPFATKVFSGFQTMGRPDIVGGFLPVFIAGIIGLVICAFFVTDYPEQCGAYRDNDRSLTPEIAKAMMEEEIKNKKTTVWTLGATLKTASFWELTLPMGFLLLCAIGMLSQSVTLCGTVGIAADSAQFGVVMLGVCIVGCIGSYGLGLLDTIMGTRKAILIAEIIMLLAGILGMIGGKGATITALMFVAAFMGAASNFTVSAAVQYWRREDFPSVFGRINPVASLLGVVGPMAIAMSLYSKGAPDFKGPFMIVIILAIISIILIFLFKPAKVKELDDKYRTAAGKPLDDALVGRK